MSLYFKLAWRNVWRNKKRSMISIASVLFAVVIALLTRSMQIGFYRHSIHNVVSFYTGYLQVQAPGYFENQSVDRSFTVSDSLMDVIQNMPHVTQIAPRVESFALASSGPVTDGVMVVGIDPMRENSLTNLNHRLVAGRYLSASDSGVLLAEGLAAHLKTEIGDTMILFGQGYHGVTAAGRYVVAGTLHFPNPELNSGMVYMTLPQARYFLAMDQRLTSLAVMIDQDDHLPDVLSNLKSRLGQNYAVLSWEDMLPELVQYIQSDNASGIIMLIIVYMVIGFGILGTILMMTLERTREFGMLMAVGMRRTFLQTLIVLESVMLSLVGAASGLVVGIPVLLYLARHPIRMTGEYAEIILRYGFDPVMPFATDPAIFLWQGLSVLIIAFATSLYPLLRISKLEPVSALRAG